MTKVYGEKRAYFVEAKSKISEKEMLDYSRKNFRVRADQVAIGNAKYLKKEDAYNVFIDNGDYWCTCIVR